MIIPWKLLRCLPGVAGIALGTLTPGANAIASDRFESWLERRDRGVVRQRFDFSCGVASLATILTHYFGDPVDEQTLLRELSEASGVTGREGQEHEGGVSFADLARLAVARGYVARGLSVEQGDLSRLRTPDIVALRAQL